MQQRQYERAPEQEKIEKRRQVHVYSGVMIELELFNDILNKCNKDSMKEPQNKRRLKREDRYMYILV